jgi:uncharacterized pyridoxal phosphate-containing UPF0001 family protein
MAFHRRVQRNKASRVAEATLVHSLADLRVAAALDAAARARGAGRASRAGESRRRGDEGRRCARALPDSSRRCARLAGSGSKADDDSRRPSTRAMRGALSGARELARSPGRAAGLAELSMGMSGDFEVAIEEGATLVRVGTALFGPAERQA